MAIDTHDPIQTTTKRMTIETDYATVNTQTDTTPTNAAVGLPAEVPLGKKYIGARYVPLFADPYQWSKESTYEPLTIVYNEGNSYTSKQYVPAGIEIDNEEYWALTGNYNAQIEQYRQEVQQISGEMGGITTDVDQLKTGKAPTMHASAGTTYGIGTESLYGHVKLYDNAGASNVDGAITQNVANDIQSNVNVALERTVKLNSAVANMSVSRTVVPTAEANVSPVTSNIGTIVVYPYLGISIFNIQFKADALIPAQTALLSTGLEIPARQQVNFMIMARSNDNDVVTYSNGYVNTDGTIGSYTQIQADTRCVIQMTVMTNNWGGDFEPESQSLIATAVAQTMKSWQGKFTYSQGDGRLDPATSGHTDCSGCIYAAYNANGITIGTTSDPQANGGYTVASAPIGEPLDDSDIKTGDIVGFATSDGDFIHVILCTGPGEFWEMNEWSDGPNAGLKGPQQVDLTENGANPSGSITTYRTRNIRKVARWLIL